jgi:hypothetical protein
VQADQCKKDDRAVVTVTAAVTKRVDATKSELSAPPANRAKGIDSAITKALGQLPDDGDVYSATGKLIIVGMGSQDDQGNWKQFTVVEVAAGGAKVLVDNLR